MAASNIALIITDLDIGGAERCLVELATRLDENRFRAVVYCLAPAPPPGGDSLLKSLQTAGIEVHCLAGQRNWQFLSIVRRLERLLQRQNAQLAQTFLFHANIVGRIAARRAGVARVVSGIRVAQRGSRWRLWLDRMTESLVDRHVCVSHGVAQFSAEQGGLAKEKLVVIPNGVDLAQFGSAETGGSGRSTVTYVGRLDRQKGLSWLLDTATAWLRELPNCDLLLVGEGPERKRLEAKCRRLGLSDRVHFAGWRGHSSDSRREPPARAAVAVGRDAKRGARSHGRRTADCGHGC